MDPALAAAIAVPVLLAGGYLWSRGRRYSAIFNPARVLELRAALPALKQKARQPVDPNDPPHIVLDDRISLAYTAHAADGMHIHHLSVSTAGYTAHAVGRTFLLIAIRLLGLPEARAEVAQNTRSSVFHAVISLSPEEDAHLQRAPVAALDGVEAALRLQQDCLRDGRNLTVGTITPEP